MTLAMLRPNEEEVKKVMQETGMDYLQAYRHVQFRNYLQKVILPQQRQYPLGKSAELA